MEAHREHLLTKQKDRQKRRTALFWTSVVIMGVLALGFGWWWVMQQKSLGVITVMTAPELPQTEEAVRFERYDGHFFSFLHQAGYRPYYPSNEGKFPILERQWLIHTGLEGRKIAIVVQDAAGSTLDEYASYRLRDMDKKAYTKEKLVQAGTAYTLFTKHEPVYEAGVFWQEKNRIMSIVLSSPVQTSDLRAELEHTLETLEKK